MSKRKFDEFEYVGRGQEVPKDVVSVRFHSSVTDVDCEAFKDRRDLREVVFNKGLKKISRGAFANCLSLESINTLPSTLTEIGDDAFYHCRQLKKVVLNDGLQVIGPASFRLCRSLQRIKFPSTITEISSDAFHDCSCLEEVIFNEGLHRIGNSAFLSCKSLTEVELPSTLVKIGTKAFENCKALQSITLPCSVIDMEGAWTFSDCYNLKKVVLNEGLKNISHGAFCGCESLENITIPSTVSEIKERTFQSCTNLREVVLKEGIKSISSNAFFRCESLERVSIPSTVAEIKSSTFSSCTNLREVFLNESLQTIGYRAFGNCSVLERFHFPTISRHLTNIINAGQVEVVTKLDTIRGLVERRGSEISISVTVLDCGAVRLGTSATTTAPLGISVPSSFPIIPGTSNWNTIKQNLESIVKMIAHYETKEATTLFELALWKTKMDQAGDINLTDRETYRIEVPGPVKNAILKCWSTNLWTPK